MPTEFATKPIEVNADFADIIRQESIRYEHANQSVLPKLINGKFDRLVLQSGLDVSPPTWLMLSVFSAVTFGGFAFLLTDSLIPLGILAAVGVMVPIVVANHMREKRQVALHEQLPDAIDRLARLTQTGRNLASSFECSATDTAQPLAGELVRVGNNLSGGASVEEALGEFSDRAGLAAVSMLSGVLNTHVELGGELSSSLFSLADDVRDQLLQRERDRAVAAEGQWPAATVILLPLTTAVIFLANESAAVTTVLDSVVGRFALCGAAVLWCLGSIVVLRIVRQVSR